MADDRPRRCPGCGAAHAGAKGEPCAACLLRLGLESEAGAPAVPSADDAPVAMPARVGDWKLIRALGEGGMGVVYLAAELGPLKRKGALKRIKYGIDSRRVLERFDQERRVLARMDHPGIARAIDAGAAVDGTPFFVMEYVEGPPITEYCDRHRLGPRRRLELFAKLCDAVEHAHRRGILHRDLKPSNILIEDGPEGPQPKVIDFGVARAIAQRRLEWSVFTEFGRLVGTPEYMSPEQADLDNEDLDTRSDVYGLGVILYELLVGTTPHDPRSLRDLGLQALLRTIREGAFPTPSSRLSTLGDEVGAIAECRDTDPARLRRGIAGDLDWIVMRATERNRERRYGSPRELGEDIQRFLDDLPVVAGPPRAAYRARKFVRRHRVGASVAAAVLAALLLGAAGLAIGLKRAIDAEALAREAEETATQAGLRAQATKDFMLGLFRSMEPDDEPIFELTALEALDRGVERLRAAFPDDPLMRATILQELGDAYESLELFDRAMPLLEESLELREQHLDLDDPDLADAHYMMGEVLAEQNRYREAIPYYERAVELLDAGDRDDPAAIPSPLRSLGNALRIVGDREAAEAAHKRAVEAARVAPGPDSALYAQTLDNLASNYLVQERLDEAESLYREALDVLDRVSPDGVDAARTRLNMANIYTAREQYEDALTLVREVAEVYARVYGDAHPQTASTRARVARLLDLLGRGDEAAAMLEANLRLLEAEFPAKHRIIADGRLYLARVYQRSGRLEEAVELMQRQIEVLNEERHRESLAHSYDRMGYLRWAMGPWPESLAAFERSGEIFAELLGLEHPTVAINIGNQGGCLRKLGRLDEARRKLDQGLEILRAQDSGVPSNRLGVANCLDFFARLHAESGNHDEAVAMFEELIEILIDLRGEDYAPLAEIRGEYAKSLRAVRIGHE